MSEHVEMTDWQKVIYGDSAQARAALAYYRERRWDVDSQNPHSGRDEIETRIYSFISGWEEAWKLASQVVDYETGRDLDLLDAAYTEDCRS